MTPDYDIKEIIAMYKNEEHNKAMERAADEQAAAAQQQAWETMRAADAAEQSAEIAEKARRDQNIAAVVSAVQTHNIVKALKK